MKRFLALVALGCLGMMRPGTAVADTPIEAFQTLCVATGAQPGAIAAAASGQGYKPTSTEKMAAIEAKLKHLRAFFLPDDAKTRLLLLGEGQLGDLKTNVCMVTYAADASDDPEASMKALLDVGAPFAAGPSKLFLFTDDDGRLHRLEPNEKPSEMAIRYSGKLRIAAAVKSEHRSVLQLHAPLAPTR